jgi:hypothetical protein
MQICNLVVHNNLKFHNNKTHLWIQLILLFDYILNNQ